MKILHVNTHVNIGGIGQYILSLTKALKDRGSECVVASSGGDLEPELRSAGIAHRYLDIKTKSELSPRIPGAVFTLSDIIKKEKIDLVHAHTRVSQVAAFFASRRAGVPYISTCHGYFRARLFRRLFDTWGKRVVAISGAVKEHLEKDFGIKAERIALIYNGIDINRFSKNYLPEEIRAAKTALGLGDGPVIGTMGRLSSVKGQGNLVDAMKHVVSKEKTAQCLIIGSGKEENSLKKRVKRLSLGGAIKFTGSTIVDIPLYLSCIDIFVLPSLKEGLGLALIEAMAAGKPCIGSRIGGINEIIEKDSSGYLVPVGDVRAMAESIEELLANKVLREEMGHKGKAIVRDKFSLDLMADKMAGLYQEVMNEK